VKTTYIVALVLALTATQVQATVIATMPNKAGGEIVLTDVPAEQCGTGFISYTTSPNGPTLYGCWWSDERMVHISYDNGSNTWSHPISNFTRVE
jgi:hypothetical protein